MDFLTSVRVLLVVKNEIRPFGLFLYFSWFFSLFKIFRVKKGILAPKCYFSGQLTNARWLSYCGVVLLTFLQWRVADWWGFNTRNVRPVHLINTWVMQFATKCCITKYDVFQHSIYLHDFDLAKHHWWGFNAWNERPVHFINFMRFQQNGVSHKHQFSIIQFSIHLHDLI